jgi:hypothetical protein
MMMSALSIPSLKGNYTCYPWSFLSPKNVRLTRECFVGNELDEKFVEASKPKVVSAVGRLCAVVRRTEMGMKI